MIGQKSYVVFTLQRKLSAFYDNDFKSLTRAIFLQSDDDDKCFDQAHPKICQNMSDAWNLHVQLKFFTVLNTLAGLPVIARRKM